MKYIFLSIGIFLSIVPKLSLSQNEPLIDKNNDAGWFSLGGRSTLNLFDHDGTGLGTGGQFRIQLSNNVNTDWFADYIVINSSDNVRSEYFHIGWSVLYYPTANAFIRPYIVAGHCFDYNKKTLINNPTVSNDRWGSAVQTGAGLHVNLTERFDISLTSQYMIHLTKELELEHHDDGVHHIHESDHHALQGHLLSTISINYKLFKLWKK